MGGKFYKKSHNWRWQRFYKLRDSKVSLNDNLEDYHNDTAGHVYDTYWDNLRDPLADIPQFRAGWDCCIDCYYSSIGMGTAEDICAYNYHRLYEKTIYRGQTVLTVDTAKKLLPSSDAYLKELRASSVPGNDVEEKLEKYIRRLHNLEHTMDFEVDSLRGAIGDFSNITSIKNAVDSKYSEFITKWACLLAPFWLRSPKTWTKESGIHILDHIFTLYETPTILLEQWFAERWNERQPIPFKWICWYIIIGQGGSLKRASAFFKWNISNKFQHFLMQSPRTSYPMESCMHAEIHRLGGTDQDYERILNHQALVIDPTEDTYDASFRKFWRSTISWLIKHRTHINDEESSLILSWALHKYTENERNQSASSFTWRGRSLNAIRGQSLEYNASLTMPSWLGHQWEGHHWDWIFEDEYQNRWDFTESTSGKQLYEEGLHMHHCVGTYSGKCISGTSAIFSLQKNGKRRVTIEIHPTSCMHIQSFGKKNRNPVDEERTIIKRWIRLLHDGQL